MSKFNKAVFFAALAPVISSLTIEGYGTVKMKQLTSDEVIDVREKLKTNEEEGKKSFGLSLVVLSVVDDEGKTVLSDEDINLLKESRNDLVDELVGKALEINGFIKKADQKNLETTPTAASSIA